MPVYFRRELHKHEKNRLVRMFDPSYIYDPHGNNASDSSYKKFLIFNSIWKGLPKKDHDKIKRAQENEYLQLDDVQKVAYNVLRKHQKRQYNGERNTFPYFTYEGGNKIYEAPNETTVNYIQNAFTEGVIFFL
jgi:hypothetical protein